MTKRVLKGDDKEPVKIRQVKSKEVICYKCQRKGHMSGECKIKTEDLKCTHCDSIGKHNTNDYCKRYQLKKKEEKKGKTPEKANKVTGKEEEESPADDSDEEGKANTVMAREDISSEDDDGQAHFLNQCIGREGEKQLWRGEREEATLEGHSFACSTQIFIQTQSSPNLWCR